MTRVTYLSVAIIVGLGVIGLRVASQHVGPYCDGERPVLRHGVDVLPMWPGEAHLPQLFETEGAEHFHPVHWSWAGRTLIRGGRHEESRQVADELAHHLDEDGWLVYDFDWPATGQVAPWYSGMAQGEALGLFAALGMHDAADAVYPTLLPGSSVVTDEGWIVEYVGFPVVLNGAIFAIAGLYDYWELTNDAGVASTLERAIAAVARDVHRFRNPGGVSSYMIDGDRAYQNYHDIHVVQLRILAEMSGMDCLRRAADDFGEDA